MAFTFDTSLDVAAPPERVWAALTDLDDWKSWMPGLVAIERRTEGPFRVGTEWKETRKLMGHEASEVFQVTALEPPGRLGLHVDGKRGSSRKGEYRFEHELTPTPAGTRLRLSGTIDVPGFFSRLLGRLFFPMMKKAIVKDLEAFRAYLESRAG